MPDLFNPERISRYDYRFLLKEERLEVLSTPRTRSCLAADPNPYWLTLFKGCGVGYTRDGHEGTWSARLKKDGRYRYVKLGFTDDIGKPSRFHFGFEEACARAQMVVSDPGQYIYPLPGRRRSSTHLERMPIGNRYTVTHAVHDFVEAIRLNASDATLRRHIRIANTHILPVIGPLACNDLSVDTLRQWFCELDVAHRTESNYARLSGRGLLINDGDAARREGIRANSVLQTLCAALESALDDDKIACKPNWRRVKKRRAGKVPRRRILTLEECEHLVSMCPNDLRKLVLGALFTGARLSELKNLRGSDFDYGTGTVFIYATKTKKARSVSLSYEGILYFERLCHTLGPTDFVFRRHNGKKWQAGDHTLAFKKACLDAGVHIPFIFHDLRHTYASHLVMAGVSLFVIAEQLGHRDIKTLVETYGHVTSSFVTEQMRSLSRPITMSQKRVDQFAAHHRSHFDKDGKAITLPRP